ncbi:formate dehydrogenase subunit delta [Ottowia sp.]|uniref:formate dehydrogenase subunit delta n=1 Tax=Ottowia sp. TaxID=1898956 RepID=UPI00263214E6|nr:formate dehydrogenase subunit delta [Ottowia sp.]
MDITNLTHMANRIGQFFEAMPDQQEAGKEVAAHLRKFWEPRMRRELLAHLDANAGEGLLPIVKNAVIAHRTSLEPPVHSAG